MKETKPTPLHHEHAPLPARGARGARFAADPGNARDSTGMDGRPLGPATTVDTEKGTSSAYASSDTGLQLREDRVKAERKLLWKFDRIIIPFAVLLYLSAYLDRGNLGNAKLQGLQSEVLRGSDTAYSIALSCFFICYIVFSIPGTLLAKAILPSTSIAIGALIWSIAATCQAATMKPAGLYVCRLFVGVGEALFGQSMALYFCYFYKKTEVSKRIAMFIGAGSAAGAFGGLISFGVSSITHPKIDKWRILFLIEGVPSFVLAICVFLFLPSRPDTTRYLTEDERTLALTRLNEDSSREGHTGIDWCAVRRAFRTPTTYTVAVMYSCMNLGLGSVSGFLPTIIKGLGYAEARAQLFTVPPYAVALVFMIGLASFSDRVQSRGLPVASVFCIGLVGWGILFGIDPIGASAGDLKARYFGCICVVTAGYSAIPLIMAWQSANSGAESQRAVSLGMLNTVGQCLAILAAFSFPTIEAPKYIKGCALNIAFQALGLILALAHTVYFRMENGRRDKREGKPIKGETLDTITEYDLARGFRYVP